MKISAIGSFYYYLTLNYVYHWPLKRTIELISHRTSPLPVPIRSSRRIILNERPIALYQVNAIAEKKKLWKF